MSRLFVVALLLAAAVATAPAQRRVDDFGRQDWCADYRDGGPSHCVVREQTLANAASVEVDAGSNGGISLRGWDRRDTHVRARVSTTARTDARARELAEAIRIETDGGRIRAAGPDPGWREHWHVSFEVQVPRDGRVRLAAHNGGISIGDFRGAAEFQTLNGGVNLFDVSGDIRGDTRNGGLNIQLSGARWDGAGLDVETRNGGVTMSIPREYSAELETGTVNGGLRIDFPVRLQGNIGQATRRITTQLGSGGARLRAVTTNGGVTVRAR